jgi:nucleoside-diphosphate-sugar epimerase
VLAQRLRLGVIYSIGMSRSWPDLLEKAHAAGVRRFVLAGSYAEYGLSADRYDFIPADAPLLPSTPYAASKAAGFIVANTFAIEKSIELYYLRIFSAYGEGQYINNFWPALRAAALSGADFPMTLGGQVRDFIPVERVAETFLCSIEGSSSVQKGVPFVEMLVQVVQCPCLNLRRSVGRIGGQKGR